MLVDMRACVPIPWYWQVGAISKFEGKSGVGLPGSDSVKGQHLLPFLPAFSAFVTRLEDLLAGLLPPLPLHTILHYQHGLLHQLQGSRL